MNFNVRRNDKTHVPVRHNPKGQKKIKQPAAVLIEELYLSASNPGMASGFELASMGFYDEYFYE